MSSNALVDGPEYREGETGKGNGPDEKEKTGETTWQVEDRDQEAGGIRRFLSAAGDEVDRIFGPNRRTRRSATG